MPLDESDLLARAHRLEPEALGQIHDLYYPPIYRYVAFRVGDEDAAADLVSEVFTRLLAALRGLTPPRKSLRAWLYRVAAHVVADHYRTQYRAGQVALDETLVSSEPEPAEIVERELSHADLREAITHLTEEQKQVIALRFIEGLSIQESAAIMRRSEGAIKQLQMRALASLGRRLSSAGES